MDTQLVEKKEVRHLIESELKQIKGMFKGGDYIFKMNFMDGTQYTNFDYFHNMDIFINKFKNKIFLISVEIDESSTSKKLIDIMYHSTSIIGLSTNQKRDYQNRMIEKISKNEKQMKSIQSTLNIINQIFPDETKFILIAHGIMDIDYEVLHKILGYKRDTIRRKFGFALDYIAISKGFLMFI